MSNIPKIVVMLAFAHRITIRMESVYVRCLSMQTASFLLRRSSHFDRFFSAYNISLQGSSLLSQLQLHLHFSTLDLMLCISTWLCGILTQRRKKRFKCNDNTLSVSWHDAASIATNSQRQQPATTHQTVNQWINGKFSVLKFESPLSLSSLSAEFPALYAIPHFAHSSDICVRKRFSVDKIKQLHCYSCLAKRGSERLEQINHSFKSISNDNDKQ